MSRTDLLRGLPGVDAVLGHDAVAALVEAHGRRIVTETVRGCLDDLRRRVLEEGLDAEGLAHAVDELPRTLQRRLASQAEGRLRSVLNATGVVVHTNLGRAPLGRRAVDRLTERAGRPLDLELDLRTGRRGGRGAGCDEALARLTGAEAACVVNNNAAALLLALNTFARNRPVVVSRGELVEIGGSFRLPDVCEHAGVELREVGTTNRTRLEDYAAACDADPPPGLLVKVHPSNFRVVGFTAEVDLADLVALGREKGVPVLMDQGSGVLSDLSPHGVVGETPVPELVATGADLVIFSGDKLLGGPQAGCLVGRADAIRACRSSPMYRVLRPGRLTLLALEATLWSHLAGTAERDVPVLRQLATPAAEVRARAEALVAAVGPALAAAGARADVVEGHSTSGGGSSPTSRVATWLVRVTGGTASADGLTRRLRTGAPPVVARIEDDGVVLDLRTVEPDDDDALASALTAALS